VDQNRKRRARGLGVDKPNADLQAMSDKELLMAFEREHSGEAVLERERKERERDNPLFAHLADLSDAELIAEYEQAAAETTALEAEREHRRPKPEAVMLPVPSTEPLEPHAVVLEPASPQPPTRKPGAHISYAVDGCTCDCCEEHTRLARQDERDRRLIAASEDEPMIEGSVRFGANASAELRQALNGR